jgi:uncharacterized hydrophobic protein (TIGR00271 family)
MSPFMQKIKEFFPKLQREERKELIQRIETGAQSDADFIIMMILSVSLASLGLLEGSTAVIIGAMIVAPLMGPLVAAGLALVQANVRLFKKGLVVTTIGLLLGLVVSLVFGVLNPGFEPSLEIEARGEPDLLDLGIAFASGMAAAYASGRSKVATTLAGVAIAAALVPPLAVVGIALTNDRLLIASNASILLITNLVAIILGAAMVFRLFGVHETVRGRRTPLWARGALLGLIIIIAFLFAPLLQRLSAERRAGSNRPLICPVSPALRVAVNKHINEWPGVELITIGRNSVEPEAGITIIMMSAKELPHEFESTLKQAVWDIRRDRPILRIFSLKSAKEYIEEPTPES